MRPDIISNLLVGRTERLAYVEVKVKPSANSRSKPFGLFKEFPRHGHIAVVHRFGSHTRINDLID
jgi:hypothetical protein